MLVSARARGDLQVQKFAPELLANLKGDCGREITVSTQRLGLLASAALWVMHPELYVAGLHMMLRLGEWAEKEGDEELLDCLKNWASVFNVVTVMCNRSTPPHRDPKCPPEALDIMMSVVWDDGGDMLPDYETCSGCRCQGPGDVGMV
ncbi:hypothetical protein AZE42_13725 [Rhizopogon vesiculosus]|uniref:Uncharacterized protein n=1 Tax=Rhizopogon vesiculosus TaxID=180088 RepID=A0A1J8QPI5_9AGAM|nr:hypothetical protein AZE42_13725 [Rhizopogon vesiculosus]